MYLDLSLYSLKVTGTTVERNEIEIFSFQWF